MEIKKELTPQEKRFCYEYLIDLNQTAAAIRAGYSSNYNSAAALASSKMNQPHIKSFIEFLKDERANRTKVDADRVVQQLANIAYFDARRLYEVDYNEDGSVRSSRLRALHELTPEEGVAILDYKEKQIHRDADAGITIIERTYKIQGKISALEQLGRHTGVFKKDNSQKTQGQVVIMLPSNGREVAKDKDSISD